MYKVNSLWLKGLLEKLKDIIAEHTPNIAIIGAKQNPDLLISKIDREMYVLLNRKSILVGEIENIRAKIKEILIEIDSTKDNIHKFRDKKRDLFRRIENLSQRIKELKKQPQSKENINLINKLKSRVKELKIELNEINNLLYTEIDFLQNLNHEKTETISVLERQKSSLYKLSREIDELWNGKKEFFKIIYEREDPTLTNAVTRSYEREDPTLTNAVTRSGEGKLIFETETNFRGESWIDLIFSIYRSRSEKYNQTNRDESNPLSQERQL
ncbi:MAG: hypothetical protein LBJ93_02600 [Clostridiales bacterium]|jgi:predicted  nucleic acid-binding Zn-ribbon protein|nr:hypothetical protein [Clostridiales bacterium]